MQPAANSMIKQPLRLMLFLLAFFMLQLCAFQMSAQAYHPAAVGPAAGFTGTHTGAHTDGDAKDVSEKHKSSGNEKHHSTKGMACSVSGCVIPVPMPPVMAQLQMFSMTPPASNFQVLHGLPPTLSDRPPISVFA